MFCNVKLHLDSLTICIVFTALFCFCYAYKFIDSTIFFHGMTCILSIHHSYHFSSGSNLLSWMIGPQEESEMSNNCQVWQVCDLKIQWSCIKTWGSGPWTSTNLNPISLTGLLKPHFCKTGQGKTKIHIKIGFLTFIFSQNIDIDDGFQERNKYITFVENILRSYKCITKIWYLVSIAFTSDTHSIAAVQYLQILFQNISFQTTPRKLLKYNLEYMYEEWNCPFST